MESVTKIGDTSEKPIVSVIIVSDYAGGESKSWSDIRHTLKGLAQQNFKETAEYLLCECELFAMEIPTDFVDILPSLKIILSRESSSYGLKNAGAKAASADIIAFLDADCLPDTNWLSSLVSTMEQHPDVVAVSGRTTYNDRNFLERVLALLSRSYLDPGCAGSTQFISNNNGAFRKSTFLAHPLPLDGGPFAARMQSESILRSGGKLLFEPNMRVIHDYEGWHMEKDIRRNLGYSSVIVRKLDNSLPYSWVIRWGYAAIPFITMGKLWHSILNCVRCSRQYKIRWYELPLAFTFAVMVHIMEIPGMILAFRKRNISETAYR